MSLNAIGFACHSAALECIQCYPDVMSCQSSACEIKLGMVWISHGSPWDQRIRAWHCSAASVAEEGEGHVVSVL